MNRAEPIRARRKESATELAKKLGVTPRTIRNAVAEERSEYLSWTSKRREDIRQLKADHPELTVRAIAERIGCSIGTVHNALKEAA